MKKKIIEEFVIMLAVAVVALVFSMLDQVQAANCGVNWEPADPVSEDILTINYVTYGDGQFVAAAGYPGGFLTSLDGFTWSWHTLVGTQIYSAATWGGNQYVAVKNQDHTSSAIRISSDGETWTGYDPGNTGGLNLHGIIWNGDQYVAVGGGDAVSLIANSSDGRVWTFGTTERGELRGVAWDGRQFVAIGESPNLSGYQIPAVILTSPDGFTWAERDSGTTQDLYDVVWGGNQFVAVGNGSSSGNGIQAIILSSPDGITWTAQNSGTTNDLKAITYGDGQYVTVGLNGTILTSSDGNTWTAQHSGTSAGLYGVAWGDDRLVAVGTSGTILISQGDEEPVVTQLINGQPMTVNANSGQDNHYSFYVPNGASNLQFLLDDLTNDLDLYVQFESQPTADSSEYVSNSYGTTSEEINISSPQAGTYYVMVYGFETGSGRLTARLHKQAPTM